MDVGTWRPTHCRALGLTRVCQTDVLCRRSVAPSERSSTGSAASGRGSDRSVLRCGGCTDLNLTARCRLSAAEVVDCFSPPPPVRTSELVRRRRRPRGGRRMTPRRRKPSPACTLEAICRNWYVRTGMKGFFPPRLQLPAKETSNYNIDRVVPSLKKRPSFPVLHH